MEQILIQDVIKNNLNLTDSQKISFSVVDIGKVIKLQLKKDFPLCDFSIRTEYYSGGCSLTISLMKSNFKVIKLFGEISEEALFDYKSNSRYTEEELKNNQDKRYHQLNPYLSRDEYNPNHWDNGVFLTEEGHKLFKRVVYLADLFNYNHSDAMIDYFDVRFYLHLEIGRWNKDFIQN